MKSSRSIEILAAMSMGMAMPATKVETRDEAPPPPRRVKPPRDLAERDVERLNAANAKRARRAARNLRLAKVSGA